MNRLWNRPRKTVVGVLRDALQTWRQREHWTMDTASDEIVKSYYNTGFDGVWLVEFQQHVPGKDAVRVMRTNNERFARWMDDQTKDSTLLPINLLPAVLQALPMDLRLQAASEILRPIGLDVSILHTVPVDTAVSSLMVALTKETGEGVTAFARVADRMTADTLQSAKIELEEAIASQRDALDHVNAMLAGSDQRCKENSRSGG
ncbi:hypothetical protein [Paludibacterium denitrificans]|uniref:Bacterial toxin YdaT domain-containing protein n=1 Tax=Paludibacterium denitrificans TaxID=2675226 RepID=A0A844GA03_9NEIS|nr:hypothetical protein [Paludibacterium denitrificans]MTD32612.1 hypothetical protein [Paludibacterium denitrificans]